MDANGVVAPVVSTPVAATNKPAKPATPAGVGLHWEWNGAKWIATKNKQTEA